VSNRVSRRQAGRWAAQEQQYAPAEQYAAPAPPQNDMGDKLEQLTQLGVLKDQGVLTDAEFEIQKNRILNP
jgi:hypothetical protein